MTRRFHALDVYVALVVAAGVACAAYVLGTGAGGVDGLLTPELGLFALCALIGELVPLKVHTRGARARSPRRPASRSRC